MVHIVFIVLQFIDYYFVSVKWLCHDLRKDVSYGLVDKG